jgi:uncharacterized C2H2 Zn-finger protein
MPTDNEKRRKRAATALRAVPTHYSLGEEGITDAISDLIHLAVAHGIEVDVLLSRCRRNFEAEAARSTTTEGERMELRCPDCVSPEVDAGPEDSAEELHCGNCGAVFERDSALVTVAEAEAHAERRAACTCDDVRGCPQCFQRADGLVGAAVRDSQGREWEVEDVGEKDGFPTICGTRCWDRPDQVEVLHEADSRSRRADGASELHCPDCGSQTISCERDAILVAEVLELRDGILTLAGPPTPQPLDDAHLACAVCGAAVEGVEWVKERPRHLPYGRRPLPDSEALDMLAAKLNEPGDWNGADVCELTATLLLQTGRRVEDEPDQEGVWS